MSSALALDHRPGRLSPLRKLRLGAEALAAYARVRRALRGSDLPTAVGRLRGQAAPPQRPPDDRAYAAGLRLARASSRTITLLPTDSRCLMRSLVLTAMLARRDVAGTVVIGVSPGEEFGAHAWVELGGRPLLPPDEATYGRLVEL
ncbi:MAG: lasso peptide biosynthesis B2 protein [Thermoleophilaceae bacterium]